MLRKYVAPYLDETIKELAAGLQKLGFAPNHLSTFGLLLSIFSGVAYGLGFFFFGAMLLLAAGLCDMLDGALARLSEEATSFGAFLDSVLDRYSDFIILSGILIHYTIQHDTSTVILILVVLLGALITSYSKARMEGLSVTCDVGLIERPERLVLIYIGSVMGPSLIVPVLWILAILSHVTAFQRILFAKSKLK